MVQRSEFGLFRHQVGEFIGASKFLVTNWENYRTETAEGVMLKITKFLRNDPSHVILEIFGEKLQFFCKNAGLILMIRGSDSLYNSNTIPRLGTIPMAGCCCQVLVPPSNCGKLFVL